MKKCLVSLLFLLAACTSTQSTGTKITLSQETAGSLQQYLGRVGSNQPGAFAVSRDGRSSYYIWCQDILCMGGPTYKSEALRRCEDYGEDCVVLAYRNKTLIPYDVEQRTVASTAAAVPAAPHVPEALRVSATLRPEIEQYLANSNGQSKNYRFLALNAAGNKLGLSTSCMIKKFGWGGWSAQGCGTEAAARQLAIDSCNDDCRVIFDGARKLGDFEIDWY